MSWNTDCVSALASANPSILLIAILRIVARPDSPKASIYACLFFSFEIYSLYAALFAAMPPVIAPVTAPVRPNIIPPRGPPAIEPNPAPTIPLLAPARVPSQPLAAAYSPALSEKPLTKVDADSLTTFFFSLFKVACAPRICNLCVSTSALVSTAV